MPASWFRSNHIWHNWMNLKFIYDSQRTLFSSRLLRIVLCHRWENSIIINVLMRNMPLSAYHFHLSIYIFFSIFFLDKKKRRVHSPNDIRVYPPPKLYIQWLSDAVAVVVTVFFFHDFLKAHPAQSNREKKSHMFPNKTSCSLAGFGVLFPNSLILPFASLAVSRNHLIFICSDSHCLNYRFSTSYFCSRDCLVLVYLEPIQLGIQIVLRVTSISDYGF